MLIDSTCESAPRAMSKGDRPKASVVGRVCRGALVKGTLVEGMLVDVC